MTRMNGSGGICSVRIEPSNAQHKSNVFWGRARRVLAAWSDQGRFRPIRVIRLDPPFLMPVKQASPS